MNQPERKLPEGWSYALREPGLWEMKCPHGVGHPVWESIRELARLTGLSTRTWSTHGCDDCCVQLRRQTCGKHGDVMAVIEISGCPVCHEEEAHPSIHEEEE